MTRPHSRRKGRVRAARPRTNGFDEQRALALLQTIHGLGSLGFLLALSDVRARRTR